MNDMEAPRYDEFLRQIGEMLPPEEAGRLADALQKPPEVSVRLNRRKAAGLTVAGGEPVAWCPEGFYLSERPAFTFDPLLHAGVYYVQDASSMFIAHALRQLAAGEPVAYLDLCAAPGGKTTAAIDALPEGSLVVCNEIDGGRAQILRENVAKWGAADCVVTNDTPARAGKMKDFFDIIAADMPCSGEGMFRKDSDAAAYWSPRAVADCAARQARIAADAWDALRPGGLFIYSTCTFNRQENELLAESVAASLGASTVEIAADPAWGISPGIGTALRCFRFMPHRIRGEGLFLTVLRKDGDRKAWRPAEKAGKAKSRTPAPAACRDFLAAPELFELETAADGTVAALPAANAARMRHVERSLNTLLAGVPVATLKGKSLVPRHELSVSQSLNPGAFRRVELPYRDAIAYLRGEAPPVGGEGHAVVTYGGHPLGFAKCLGNRANNCYPKEWRVRSAFVPAVPPEIVVSIKNE